MNKQYFICPKCRKELEFDEMDNCRCDKCGELEYIIKVREMECRDYGRAKKFVIPEDGKKINIGGLDIYEYHP